MSYVLFRIDFAKRIGIFSVLFDIISRMKKKSIIIFSVLSVFFFIAGIVIGFSMQNKSPEKNYGEKIDHRESGFEYINPLLECEYVN